MDASVSTRTRPLFRGMQVVWYLLGIVEVLLAFRFVLKLLGANAAAGFTSFIYGVTYFLAAPFLTVFRTARVEGSVFEWSTLLAMLVYLVIAWAISKLFLMSKSVSTPEAAAKLDREEPL